MYSSIAREVSVAHCSDIDGSGDTLFWVCSVNVWLFRAQIRCSIVCCDSFVCCVLRICIVVVYLCTLVGGLNSRVRWWIVCACGRE